MSRALADGSPRRDLPRRLSKLCVGLCASHLVLCVDAVGSADLQTCRRDRALTAQMVESAHTVKVNGGAQQTDGRLADTNGKVAAVQPNARTFKMPKPREYKDKDEETTEKLKTLAAAYRIFAAQGYDEGVAGHITLRDPKGRGFWSVRADCVLR